MNNAVPDQGLWEAFVEAKRELHRRQAEFYRHVGDRQAVLRAALGHGSDNWQRATAFDFLQTFPGDVMALLPEVFHWATKSERWAARARQAIARLPRDKRMMLLEPLFLDQLQVAEDDDYPDLAALAADCEEWPGLLMDITLVITAL